MERLFEPVSIFANSVEKSLVCGVAVFEETIAVAVAEVAACLGVFFKEGVLAHSVGKTGEPGAFVEEGFDEKRHDHGVVGLHALGGFLVDVFVHFAPGNSLGGRTGGE